MKMKLYLKWEPHFENFVKTLFYCIFYASDVGDFLTYKAICHIKHMDSVEYA